MALQHTIKNRVSLSGVGLHTGQEARVTICPAPENHGIRFVRSDLPNAPEIKADVDNVVDNARGTAIGRDGVTVHTVEHIMAAFAGMEIDNCRVEVEASEIPLMDGSALPFVDLIRSAGIEEQAAQREFIVIDEPMLLYQKDDVACGAFPMDHFHITLMVDYKHPALGAQHTTMFNLRDFEKDFAPARTFCFLSEIEQLREKGLIKGGSLSSAVVVQDVDLTGEHIEYMRSLFNEKGRIESGTNGFLNNTQLRFYNELCRHKALDLMGDLYLLGKPLCAHILAARTGHAANHELAKRIRAYVAKKAAAPAAGSADGEIQVTYDDILNILPHRYPFLLIDKVLEIVPDKRVVAMKNVSFNDPFFEGHFPGDPVMPGVLQIEAMAQAGGIMGLYSQRMDKERAIAFLGIDKARFRERVRPGDHLRIEVEMLQNRRGTIRFAGKCYVGKKLVCEAEMMAMLTRK